MHHCHRICNLSTGASVSFRFPVSSATSCHITSEESTSQSERKESHKQRRTIFRFQNVAQQDGPHCLIVNSVHRIWHLYTDCASGAELSKRRPTGSDAIAASLYGYCMGAGSSCIRIFGHTKHGRMSHCTPVPLPSGRIHVRHLYDGLEWHQREFRRICDYRVDIW